jgi:hypothetical protein
LIEKGCKNLWAAVLEQAIQDAQCEIASYKDKVEYIFSRNALEWFYSDGREIGSFLWICNILDIDPKSVFTLFTNKDNANIGQSKQAVS